MRIEPAGSAITSTDDNPPESSGSPGARGAPTADALQSITNDTERVRAAFTSPEGLIRLSGEEERRVTFAVVMVVTDERTLFVGGESSPGGFGGDAGTLAYSDLAAVSVEGKAPGTLSLSMEDGVCWEFPLPDADPEVVDSVVRHLRWVGEVRSRVVACRNDVELAAGEIRDHAKAMEWDAATEVYEQHRERLDRLVDAVQLTEPIDEDVLAPELTEMGRTLERAYARLFVERAESQLELGQQLIDNEDYDQARKVLQSAQEYYERASARADAVERGDSFRFGEQRELRDDLDHLEWEIEAVAAEPIRQAHEAKIKAQNATDRSTAVDHWETAFRRYGNVLTLDWGDDGRNFAGDPDAIREEMATAATHLVDGHRELAERQWDEGVTLEEGGAIKSAILACTDARDHLDRALELAEEFEPGAAPDIEQRRDRMAQAVREMRDTASVDRQSADDEETSDSEDEAETETDSSSSERSDLRAIDTHQEITFDATVEDGESMDDGHEEAGADEGDGVADHSETPVGPERPE